ncbi:sulfate transmembrane transporter [Actinidia rufa]|uniref:Amine oxidase n=1 Tax=Actinidia rufa TaxID=165716 RepID=A0A7J0GJY0_9ERIC|nr:sulfate transmembrane transporter [Actinidia rufa]
MYPGGEFPNQNPRVGEGLATWAEQNRSLEETDVVLCWVLAEVAASTSLRCPSHPSPMVSRSQASCTRTANRFRRVRNLGQKGKLGKGGDGRGVVMVVMVQQWWYVFGATHIPRLEDWPVMPVDRIGLMLGCVTESSGVREKERAMEEERKRGPWRKNTTHPPTSPRRSTVAPPPRHQPPPQDHHLVGTRWRRGRPRHLHPHRPLPDPGFLPRPLHHPIATAVSENPHLSTSQIAASAVSENPHLSTSQIAPPQECPPQPPSSSLAPPLTLEERCGCGCGWVVFFLHGSLSLTLDDLKKPKLV